MGRYKYNEDKVNDALDVMKKAKKELEETKAAMTSGFKTISSARGAEYIDIDSSAVVKYPDAAIDSITKLIKAISNKSKEIKEYDEAPWWKKLFATIGMGFTKLVEGIGTAIESLGDGVVTLVGAVGGLFNSDFKNSCAEYVKKDHVGDFFYEQYENGFLSSVNDYSIMSHQSTAANIFKGVGVATGYVAAAAATGGSSLAANVAVAGLGGLGSGTERGLQEGKDFYSAMGTGVKQAAVNAGTVFVAGKATQAMAARRAGTQVIVNSTDDVARITSGASDDILALPAKGQSSASTIANSTDDVANVATAGTKSAKEILKNAGKDLKDVAKNSKIGTKVTNATNKVKSAASTAKDKVVNSSVGKKVTNATSKVKNATNKALYGDDVAEQLAIDGAGPIKYGKEVLKSKVSSAASKVSGAASKVKSTASNAVSKVANNGVVKTVNRVIESHPVAAKAIATAGFASQVVSNENAKNQFRTSNVKKAATESYSPVIGTGFAEKKEILASNGNHNKSSKNKEDDSKNKGDNSKNKGDTSKINQKPTTKVDQKPTTKVDQKPITKVDQKPITKVDQKPTTKVDQKPITKVDQKPTTEIDQKPTTEIDQKPTTEVDQKPTTEIDQKPITETVTQTPSNNVTSPTQVEAQAPSSNNYSNGYNNYSNGYNNYSSDNYSTSSNEPIGSSSDITTTEGIEDTIEPTNESITDTVEDTIKKGSNYTKIPTSSEPISTSSSSGSSVIPIAAGITAAAAAGIGAKAYLDKKKKNDNEEYEEEGITDGIDTEDWSDQDSVNIDYDDSTAQDEYLDSSDEYSYKPEPVEAYGARTEEDLANLQ